jgi:hypothetical protein
MIGDAWQDADHYYDGLSPIRLGPGSIWSLGNRTVYTAGWLAQTVACELLDFRVGREYS